MKSKIDYCKFFAEIEDNPRALTPRITVRQMLEAKEHLYGCDSCFMRSERVLAKAPKEKFTRPGKN